MATRKCSCGASIPNYTTTSRRCPRCGRRYLEDTERSSSSARSDDSFGSVDFGSPCPSFGDSGGSSDSFSGGGGDFGGGGASGDW
jgi:predicted RNA-binding Zn-ribbon protein involved in translation (DUF1610 family)